MLIYSVACPSWWACVVYALGFLYFFLPVLLIAKYLDTDTISYPARKRKRRQKIIFLSWSPYLIKPTSARFILCMTDSHSYGILACRVYLSYSADTHWASLPLEIASISPIFVSSHRSLPAAPHSISRHIHLYCRPPLLCYLLSSHPILPYLLPYLIPSLPLPLNLAIGAHPRPLQAFESLKMTVQSHWISASSASRHLSSPCPSPSYPVLFSLSLWLSFIWLDSSLPFPFISLDSPLPWQTCY